MKRSSPVLITVAGLTIAALVALGAFIGSRPGPPAMPTAAASTAPVPPGTFENTILGYQITLRQDYRRDRALIFTGQDSLGVDLYTLQSEQQAREACERDSGDGPPPRERLGDLRVGASRNVQNVSAFEWASTSPRSTHHKVERTMVDGQEAARLVQDNASAETSMFVVRANDRIYEVGLEMGIPEGAPRTYLDDIARTFRVVPPAPFPSPTATTPPRDAGGQLARALRDAFGAKDADAVARLMPECHLVVYPLINGEPPGGFQARSVVQFTQGLRERFAAGDLTVTVDTTLRPFTREEGAFLLTSEWREPDRTTRVDLVLAEREGRWRWSTAEHHGDWPCRKPWVTQSSC